MTRYVVAVTSIGEIVRTCECEADQSAAQALTGEVVIEDATATAATHYVTGGTTVVAYSGPEAAAKAARPLGAHEWNNATMAWDDTRTLSDAKTDQQAMIREERAADDAAGFTWDGDTFASDLVSQSRINTAMLSAIVAQRDSTTLSVDWPLADGSYRAMDEDDLVALGQALYAHMAAGLAAEKAAYDDITAATTIPDVVSVGWPP